MPSCAPRSERWRPSGGGSAPPHRRHARAPGNHAEPEEAPASLCGGEAPGAPARRAEAGAGHAPTDGGAEGREPALVARLRFRRLHRRAEVPHPRGGRRLYAGVPGARAGHLDLRSPGRTGTRCRHRVPRAAENLRLGQRDGARQHGHPRLDAGARYRLALHRARQADPRHAFAESFIGRLRDECLNETLFSSLPQARSVLATWREDYNRLRPHSALGNAAPAEFAEKIRLAREAA